MIARQFNECLWITLDFQSPAAYAASGGRVRKPFGTVVIASQSNTSAWQREGCHRAVNARHLQHGPYPVRLRPLAGYGLLALSMFQVGLVACGPDSHRADARWRDSVAAIDPSQPIEAQFATIAESAVSHEIVEGVQFTLVENGRILATEAFGVAERESGRPMSADTRINVASISKAVTAWGYMHFSERSNRDIDAPINGLLNDDQLYTDVFANNDVTSRMLLSHTSGLSGASVPVTPATQALPTLADVLRGRSTVDKPEMKAAPGKRFLYSGIGYLVLQKVIEEQTQRSFGAFMTEAVLEPARMNDSSFSLDEAALDAVAVYYRSDGRRREPYQLPGAAGGLYSSARDMGRFIILYTDAGSGKRRQNPTGCGIRRASYTGSGLWSRSTT